MKYIAGMESRGSWQMRPSVISSQQTPLGIPLYLILARLAQTDNENHSFASDIMEKMCQCSKECGKCKCIESFYRWSFMWRSIKSRAAEGLHNMKSDQLTFPCTNHNVKIASYQSVGGSRDSPVLLGKYMFDAVHLKMVEVAIES